MAIKCEEGEHWDGLLKQCLQCDLVCHQTPITSRCISYCESAHCKLQPGHYYDLLLKKCMTCAEVCGRHPAECSRHCQTLPSAATTQTLTAEVTHMQTLVLDDPNILIYSLLALCLVLVVSSLSIALGVFPRRSKDASSNSGPKKAKPKGDCVVKLGEEVGSPSGQQRPNAYETSPTRLTEREPIEDPNPTETCVCVHCFPDLKALGQNNDRPLTPFTFYQQAVLHKAQAQKGASLWTEDSTYSSGVEVQEEAAVG